MTTSTPTRAPGYGMRLPPSSRARLGGAALAAAVGLAACGASDSKAPAPQAALAGSAAAQRDFRALEQHWLALSPERRSDLEPRLRAFVAAHPADRRSRLARVRLAWIAASRGEVAKARALARQTARGADGVARDAARIVEAALWVREGQPERALALLAPLVGKVVDADDRRLFGEQIVLAALAAGRWHFAIEQMAAWLAHADEADRESITAAVERQLLRVPPGALERSLGTLDAQAAAPIRDESSVGRSRERLRKAMWRQLATDALERDDAALASRLLEAGPPRLHVSDLGRQLARLSTGGGVMPSISGKTVGLLLALSSEVARRRSAEIAAGMSRALGLPASAARPGTVRLALRDDAGGVERGLAELAGEGASILVAGTDDASRARAAAHAEAVGIPVILVGDPDGLPAARHFAFVAGASRTAATDLLRATLAERGLVEVAALTGADAGCGAPSGPGRSARFPVSEWLRRRADAVLVTADAACALDALRIARASGLTAPFALGLDASSLTATTKASGPLIAISAGSYPYRRGEPVTPDLAEWVERHGVPTWSEVLGRDVALLAAAALDDFPLHRVTDAREVTALHRRAAARLMAARASLWSSAENGFDDSRSLRRTLRAVEW